MEDLIPEGMYSVEAEQSVIGSIMLDNGIFDKVSEVVNSSDFFIEFNRIIFSRIESMSKKGIPFDPVTIVEHYSEEEIEKAGGISYLTDLVESVPDISHADSYAKIIKEKSLERSLLRVSGEIRDLAGDKSRTASERLQEAQAIVFDAEEKSCSSSETVYSMEDAVKQTVSRLDRVFRGEEESGFMSGIADYDKRHNGYNPDDLVIIAGRPSSGKTTVALNQMLEAGKRGEPTLFFSVETGMEPITRRFLSNLGSVPMDHVQNPKELDGNDWTGLSMAVTKLKNMPITIDDAAGLTIGDIRSRARSYFRKIGKQKAIFIDHMGKIRIPGKNEVAELGHISNECKEMAKELGCPVILLVQLNRGCETRPGANGRPKNSDLRGSGKIEEDADVITFVYREEVNVEDTDRKGIMDLITGKARDGEIGTDPVQFIGRFNRVTNITKEFYSQNDYT